MTINSTSIRSWFCGSIETVPATETICCWCIQSRALAVLASSAQDTIWFLCLSSQVIKCALITQYRNTCIQGTIPSRWTYGVIIGGGFGQTEISSRTGFTVSLAFFVLITSCWARLRKGWSFMTEVAYGTFAPKACEENITIESFSSCRKRKATGNSTPYQMSILFLKKWNIHLCAVPVWSSFQAMMYHSLNLSDQVCLPLIHSKNHQSSHQLARVHEAHHNTVHLDNPCTVSLHWGGSRCWKSLEGMASNPAQFLQGNSIPLDRHGTLILDHLQSHFLEHSNTQQDSLDSLVALWHWWMF